jgi:hypothetical protein
VTGRVKRIRLFSLSLQNVLITIASKCIDYNHYKITLLIPRQHGFAGMFAVRDKGLRYKFFSIHPGCAGFLGLGHKFGDVFMILSKNVI